VVRPRMKLHGAWAFSYCLELRLLDEDAPHDSSFICQLLAETLERVSLRRNLKCPSFNVGQHGQPAR
jgi:hypothetical protein